jgi:hypothetical protein
MGDYGWNQPGKPSDCFIGNAQTISRIPAMINMIRAMTALL